MEIQAGSETGRGSGSPSLVGVQVGSIIAGAGVCGGDHHGPVGVVAGPPAVKVTSVVVRKGRGVTLHLIAPSAKHTFPRSHKAGDIGRWVTKLVGFPVR